MEKDVMWGVIMRQADNAGVVYVEETDGRFGATSYIDKMEKAMWMGEREAGRVMRLMATHGIDMGKVFYIAQDSALFDE